MLIGLTLIVTGITILAYQNNSGDFEKGSKITRNVVGLFGAAAMGIFGGLYFLVKSFG